MPENNNYMHKSFTHSEYSVAELINVFQQCSERISVLDRHSSEDFKALNSATRNYYKQALAIQQIISQLSAVIQVNHSSFSKEAEECLQCISNIITDLQFHDIIKQKLEHIQQTIQEIISELASVQQQTAPEVVHPVKYLLILSEITKLHSAQLQQTNTDYQKAITNIKTSLQTIEQHCEWLTKKFTDCFLQYNSVEVKEKFSYINWITNQLSTQIQGSLLGIKYDDSFAYQVSEINKDMHKIFSGWIGGIKSDAQLELLKQLENLYTMESERAIHHQVFNINEEASRDNSSSAGTGDIENLELF